MNSNLAGSWEKWWCKCPACINWGRASVALAELIDVASFVCICLPARTTWISAAGSSGSGHLAPSSLCKPLDESITYPTTKNADCAWFAELDRAGMSERLLRVRYEQKSVITRHRDLRGDWSRSRAISRRHDLAFSRYEGALVCKCFHGSGYDELSRLFKTSFRVAKPIKPKASRGKSAETFLVGIGPKRP